MNIPISHTLRNILYFLAHDRSEHMYVGISTEAEDINSICIPDKLVEDPKELLFISQYHYTSYSNKYGDGPHNDIYRFEHALPALKEPYQSELRTILPQLKLLYEELYVKDL